MSYLAIPDFKYGQDRRRKRISGVPGTLWTLKNAHLSRGGDIERAKKFVSKFSLPAGTFGLAKVRRQLYAFGSDDLAATMPVGVQYQRLQGPSTPNMVRLLDWKVFTGKIYAIAEYDDGNIYHFYDGTRVTDWDTLGASNSNLTVLASYFEQKLNASDDITALASGSEILITANVAGTGFTLSGAAVNNGADNTQSCTTTTITNNVAAVDETRASATVTITGGSSSPGINKISDITISGTSLMAAAADWTLSNEATANAVASQINNLAATHGFTATATDNVITIVAAPGTGDTLNGSVIMVTNNGNVTFSQDLTLDGGVTAVEPVAQVSKVTLGGVFEAADKFTITLNGVDYIATGLAAGTGVSVFIRNSRIWSVANTLLNGCKLNDPTNWSDNTASTGFVSIDVSGQSDGTERLVGMETYQLQAAVFSEITIRLYTLAADSSNISLDQSMNNTGSKAGRGIISYGNNDVFYLDSTGIRSLRQRDTVNAAFVSDVGNAIDTFVREHVKTLPRSTVERAVALMEPTDGRLWYSIGERIYVFSYFPSSKINAWSYYEPPVPMTEMIRVGDQVYTRGGDTIYLYGGDSGDVYPDANEQEVVIELPFLTAEKPANEKVFKGYDTALDNEWFVQVLPDPNDEAKVIDVGRINRNTFHLPELGLPVRSSCMAINLTCSRAGAATISALTLHFDAKEPPK